MSRGVEIVRRLLLTAMWVIVAILAFTLTWFGINNYTKDYWSLKIKSHEEAEKLADLVAENDQLDKELGNSYEAKDEESEMWKNVKLHLEKYYDEMEQRKKEMWMYIGFSIICPLVGFGLHKLINWIMVHKHE